MKGQIRAGGKYRAKSGGTVRVVLVAGEAATRYHVLNTQTGRIEFAAAVKLHEEVLQ